ncbi:MAG: DUF805 domain-containing protein [Pseudomonadota bacterium]
MSEPLPAPTVKWLLFSFRGRIGRKSFALGALMMVLIQFAIVAWLAGLGEGTGGDIQLSGGEAIMAFFVMIGFWIAMAWALLAMAAKRLHDLDLPGILAVLLIIPAISLLTFLALAFMPGSRNTNRHGPPPFARD